MKTILEQLENLADQALRSLGSVQPTADKPAEYQWGLHQGRYKGLLEAVKLVSDFEDSEEEFNDNL